MPDAFHALFIDQGEDAFTAEVRELSNDDLPDGDVLIEVLYSSLNYKDGLAVTGKGKIIRGDFPFIPGIDLVGRVETSSSPDFEAGDVVIQTGGGLGESIWGGFSQKQRIPAKWLVPLPEGMTPLRAMEMGTAGFTAMLSVIALENQGLSPDGGEVLVTGASGGVGSVAVAILAHLGYKVTASSGSEDAYDYLRDLGASTIIHRKELSEGPARPMQSARWMGAVDTVGDTTLASVLSMLDRHGAVASCGNAGGYELHTTVFPFILRGVSLLGIDSNTAPLGLRNEAWRRLVDMPKTTADRILAGVIHLDQVPAMSEKITQGGICGRIVVDVNA